MSTKRVVKSWDELFDEVIKLDEFYSSAQAILEDLRVAIRLKDPELLSRVLEAWGGLRPLATFSVDPAMWSRKEGPGLRLLRN